MKKVNSLLLEQRLIQILLTNRNLLRDLEAVKSLGLPQWCIAAGYVRNCVWDDLHGFASRTPLNDVDVLYFDPTDLREEVEKTYEMALKEKVSDYNWSVKNQARMHIRNQERPYTNVADAMKRWPETATATGVSLDHNGNFLIIAPHGLEDLFDLVIRKSPYFKDRDYFFKRVENKKWTATWPKLIVVDEEHSLR